MTNYSGIRDQYERIEAITIVGVKDGYITGVESPYTRPWFLIRLRHEYGSDYNDIITTDGIEFYYMDYRKKVQPEVKMTFSISMQPVVQEAISRYVTELVEHV